MRRITWLLQIKPSTEWLVVGLISILLLSLAAPAVLQMRDQARQNQKDYQLKNLGQAMSTYHDTHQSFPSSVSSSGREAPKKKKKRAEPMVSPLVVLPLGLAP